MPHELLAGVDMAREKKPFMAHAPQPEAAWCQSNPARIGWRHRTFCRPVWHGLGIYHALLSIGVSGQSTIDKVAGPVGEALIMTAPGLAVAIPAVLGYNALTRGNKHILNKPGSFAHDLHAYFVTGARVSSGNPANVLAMKKGG